MTAMTTLILLIILASLAAVGIAFLFTWALWRANHLGENTKFFAWIKCEVKRGHHRPAKHPMGGQRCLDCFASGDDLDETGHVNPGRKTYDVRRGGAA